MTPSSGNGAVGAAGGAAPADGPEITAGATSQEGRALEDTALGGAAAAPEASGKRKSPEEAAAALLDGMRNGKVQRQEKKARWALVRFRFSTFEKINFRKMMSFCKK